VKIGINPRLLEREGKEERGKEESDSGEKFRVGLEQPLKTEANACQERAGRQKTGASIYFKGKARGERGEFRGKMQNSSGMGGRRPSVPHETLTEPKSAPD